MNATTDLKALALQVLQRNRQCNISATGAEKERNKPCNTSTRFVAQNSERETLLSIFRITVDGKTFTMLTPRPDTAEAECRAQFGKRLVQIERKR